MPERFTQQEQSEIMRKVKSSQNLSTEIRMVELFKQNHIVGWRRKYYLFGNTDFVFLKKKIALFIDGCFWHGHDCRNLKPLTHKDNWQNKVQKNRKRDEQVSNFLIQKGWVVYRFWECELSKNKLSVNLLVFLQGFSRI